MTSNRRTARSLVAFTILELLVAMAVLTVLMIVLLSMVDGATRLWRQSENRVDSYREARAALNVIASDLATMYASTNTSFFLDNSTQLDIEEEAPTNLGGKLFFLTAQPTSAQGEHPAGTDPKSDLCAVGYFLAFNKTSFVGSANNPESYNLYRYFRSSNETFSEITNSGKIVPGTKILTGTTGEEILAKNITGFFLQPWTMNPGSTNLTAFAQSTTTPIPDVLDITLKAINSDSAKRFTGKSQWEDTNSITHSQEERIFKTRIYLDRAAQVKAVVAPQPSNP